MESPHQRGHLVFLSWTSPGIECVSIEVLILFLCTSEFCLRKIYDQNEVIWTSHYFVCINSCMLESLGHTACVWQICQKNFSLNHGSSSFELFFQLSTPLFTNNNDTGFGRNAAFTSCNMNETVKSRLIWAECNWTGKLKNGAIIEDQRLSRRSINCFTADKDFFFQDFCRIWEGRMLRFPLWRCWKHREEARLLFQLRCFKKKTFSSTHLNYS